MNFAYIGAADEWIVENDYEYTQPVPDPPVFCNFTTGIEEQIYNTMRISNLSDFTSEIGNAGSEAADKERYDLISFSFPGYEWEKGS